MPKRLIRRRPAAHIVHGLRLVIDRRPINPLVRVRRALRLNSHLVIRALAAAAGTAAGAKGPENARHERAGDSEPDVDEHGAAEVELDASALEGEVEGAAEAGEGDGHEDGEGGQEEVRDHAGDGREDAAEAREQPADADDDFDGRGDDREDEERGDPFRGCLLVVVDRGVEVVGEHCVEDAAVEAPHGARVEGEV